MRRIRFEDVDMVQTRDGIDLMHWDGAGHRSDITFSDVRVEKCERRSITATVREGGSIRGLRFERVAFAEARPGFFRGNDDAHRIQEVFFQAFTVNRKPVHTLKAAGIPARTCCHYNRRYAYPYRPFIREWQLIGPLANEEGKGLDIPYGPELEGVQLASKIPGVFEEIVWQKHESRWDHIDLGSVFGPLEKVLAYAACWVHSDRERPAALVAGSDEACKVWINRALVLRTTNTADTRVSETIVPIQLKPGWNEVLVKLSQQGGHWGFELEITDANLSRASSDLKMSAVPPE